MTYGAHHTAARLLELLAGNATAPVCLFDIPRIGGATYYSLRRMEEYLARGRGVVRLTCAPDGALTGTVHYGSQNASFQLSGLHTLFASFVPDFHTILVNSLVGWTLPAGDTRNEVPVGEGRPRWIPAVTGLIARLADQWKTRLEIVMHDYFPVCPNFILLNDSAQSRYCGVPGPEQCADCLRQPFMRAPFGPSFSITAWREAWSAFLARANEVTCPSAPCRDILLRAFSPEGKNLQVVPHESLLPAHAPLVLPGKDSPMHIAVVGQITIPKGAAIVRQLALLLKERRPEARITLVGALAVPGMPLPDNVTVTGIYEKAHLTALLRDLKVTVGFVSSVWPETFHYVTQELMALHLPLVSFDLGAPAERLRGWEHGRIAKEISAGAALEALELLDAERKSPPVRPL